MDKQIQARLCIHLAGCEVLGWFMGVCARPGPSTQLGMLFRTSLSSADEVRNTGYMVEPGDTDG